MVEMVTPPPSQVLIWSPVVLDLGPRRLQRRAVGQLGKPIGRQRRPLLPAQGRSTGESPAASAGATYLRTVFGSTPSERAQLDHLPPGMPMLENLGYIDHLHRSPCHIPPRLDQRGDRSWTEDRSEGCPPADNEGIT